MPIDPTTLPDCLQEFTVDQILAKIEALIDTWPSSTLSPMGLCRAHDVGLVQLRALTALPMFREIRADIRCLQQDRREEIEQNARDLALDRLCYLAHQTPTSAASCKEIRLATKAFLDLVGPPPQRAPSVSDGVNHEPEASAPGPNQPRPAGSGSTDANEPETSTNHDINEESPIPTRSITPTPQHPSHTPTLTPNPPAPDPNTAPPPAQTTTPTHPPLRALCVTSATSAFKPSPPPPLASPSPHRSPAPHPPRDSSPPSHSPPRV